MCSCNLCEIWRRGTNLIENGTPGEKNSIISEILEKYTEIYTKLEFILATTGNGKWPECTEMMEFMINQNKNYIIKQS